MSRRFGRNQRRRAREALAQAQSTIDSAYVEFDRLTSVVAETSNQLGKALRNVDELCIQLADIASRLSHYAITAGVPTRFESDWLARIPMFRLPVAQRPQCIYSALRRGGAEVADALHFEVMRVLDVECIYDQFARDMHCRIYFDDHVVGYGISDHALRNMTSDELERRIAPEIARLLVKGIKEAK